MSQALMDYVTARHALLTAVLDMLAAEYRLSDENSSVIALTGAEDAVALAARDLLRATDEAPAGQRPVGWERPAGVTSLPSAKETLTRAALRVLAAEHADETADAASEAEYASEQLAIAARDLAVIVDRLPKRPKGWEQ